MFTPVNVRPLHRRRHGGRNYYWNSRTEKWYTERFPNTYLQYDDDTRVPWDALVELTGDAVPRFARPRPLETGTVATAVAESSTSVTAPGSDAPEVDNTTSIADASGSDAPEVENITLAAAELAVAPGSDAPEADLQLLMDLDNLPSPSPSPSRLRSPFKGKARAVSVSPKKRRLDIESSLDDEESRAAAIEYLKARCTGRVKGVDKGGARFEPVPIVEKPVFEAGSPLFGSACCVRCSKLVGSEGLYCIRPTKHSKCYRCANNGVSCEPIPAQYKTEFKKVQGLFQAGTLEEGFAAREQYDNGVTAFAHNSKPKPKSRAGSATAALFDSEFRAYLDKKFAMIYRNQERALNYMREKNGDEPVGPIEDLFDDDDEDDDDAFAGYVLPPE